LYCQGVEEFFGNFFFLKFVICVSNNFISNIDKRRVYGVGGAKGYYKINQKL